MAQLAPYASDAGPCISGDRGILEGSHRMTHGMRDRSSVGPGLAASRVERFTPFTSLLLVQGELQRSFLVRKRT